MIKMGSDQSDEALAQASRLRHHKRKGQIFAANNESDVRQGVLAYLDLDLFGNLEKYRVDYAHDELWLEVKYNGNFEDRASRCRVISQMLHYLHYAPIKRGEVLLPESFGIVDKNHFMLYDTSDFGKYIINLGYFKDIKSPSAPHPELEKALFADPLIETRMYRVLSEYDEIWTELDRRGIYNNT